MANNFYSNNFSPEDIANFRQIIENDLDTVIKDDPQNASINTVLYWFSLNMLIRIDMIEIVHNTFSQYIQSTRFDKDFIPTALEDVPYVTIKEFFAYMRKIDDLSKRDVLDEMKGLTMSKKEQILDAVIINDFEKFDNLIKNTDYDFSTSAKLARMISATKSIFTTSVETKEDIYYNNYSQDLNEYVISKFPNIDKLLTEPIDSLNNDELLILGSHQKWITGISKGLVDEYLLGLPEARRKIVLSKIPTKTYEAYKNVEIPDDFDIYLSLISNDDITISTIKCATQIEIAENTDDNNHNNISRSYTKDTDLFEINRINGISEQSLNIYPDSKYGFIPENYFDENNKPSGIHEEYFNTELFNESFRNGKLEEFVTMINYLCDMRYIENNNRTKAILAYRLTGLNRPSGEVIEKIDWETSEPSKLYSLLYLIRHWTRHMNPKYSKCLDFFNNIQARDIANGSSKTKDATNEFQDFLNKLYGNDLFPIEHEKQRKALKKINK